MLLLILVKNPSTLGSLAFLGMQEAEIADLAGAFGLQMVRVRVGADQQGFVEIQGHKP